MLGENITIDPVGHFAKAIDLHKTGAIAEALAICEDILAQWPQHFPSLNLGAYIHYHRGALVETRRYLEKALAIDSTNLTVLSRLAQLDMDSRSFIDALTAYEHVLAVRPDHLEALNNCGTALMELQRPSEALKHFEEAVRINPNIPEIHFNRGNALRDNGRLADAAHSYSMALDLRPQYAEALHNRANVLRDLMRPVEALEDYDKSLLIESHSPSVYNNKGVVSATLGLFDNAIASFERAIELQPRMVVAYYNITTCKTFRSADPLIGKIKDLLQIDPPLEDAERAYLHFGLAKALSDIGDYHHSFLQLLKGNELKRQHIAYNEPETFQLFDAIRTSYSRDRMRHQTPDDNPSVSPIFIIGMPRSGSSMIEQALSGSDDVFGSGESDDFISSIGDVASDAESAIVLSQLTNGQLREIGRRYIDRKRACAPKAKYVIDKTLSNFRFVGLIQLALPNARFIHTIRNPIDTCLSCFSKLFTEANQPFTYDLAELGRYYRAYQGLMDHWQSALPTGAMLDLNYETLVGDLEFQLRRIFAHCEINWDSRYLAFDQVKRPVHTASKFQVRQPLFNSSIGQWRHYEAFLRPLFDNLDFADGNSSATAKGFRLRLH